MGVSWGRCGIHASSLGIFTRRLAGDKHGATGVARGVLHSKCSGSLLGGEYLLLQRLGSSMLRPGSGPSSAAGMSLVHACMGWLSLAITH